MNKSPGRILVVDDLEDNRDLLQRQLVRRGYEVAVADSGLTALAEIARSSFDLVLLDIMMPGMNGLETLERLRSIADPGMLPVIMVSAKDKSGDIVEALELGASDYISKPIDFPVAFARVETHLKMKRFDDALRSSEARSLFLANMSHELRTPLNAIIGFSDIIYSELLGPGRKEKYKEYAGLIKESGEHLLGTVSDILDLVAIQSSGGVELDETEFDAAALIETCVAMVPEQPDAGDVSIAVEFDDKSLPALRADQERFKQIVLNLLWNAVRFTPPGGSVAVRLWYRDEGGFVIQVEDTGIGIKDIPKALDIFRQEVSASDHAHGGIGIGLPFTKALVERHGGSFDLQSKVGVGTTVTVRLPADRAVKATTDAALEVSA